MQMISLHVSLDKSRLFSAFCLLPMLLPKVQEVYWVRNRSDQQLPDPRSGPADPNPKSPILFFRKFKYIVQNIDN